ncbi:MAG: hypothetical protein ACFFB5_04890 [Promethearchaeota archaeon]
MNIPNEYDLIVRDQKVSLKKVENSYIISLSIKKDKKWIKSLEIPLLTLENQTDLHASELIKLSSSKIKVSKSLSESFSISTNISANEALYPWFHFHTTLIAKKDTTFIKRGPEIQLSLIPKITDSKEIISINQPTRHTPPTNEWKSNDMPAAYIWNPQSGVETFFFVDFSQMEWMSPENIERFSIYECGFQRNGSFGLLHRIPLESAIQIPKNFRMVFDSYLSLRYRQKKPSKWEAVESLVTKCMRLIPGSVPYPRNDLTWTEFSSRCIDDLMKENYCWVGPRSPKYHAYVMDRAELKRREIHAKKHFFETMTLLDILPPWILYLQLHKDENQEEHVKRTCKSLSNFIDPKLNILYNNIEIDESGDFKIIKPAELTIGDSWYLFEPILRFGWLIRLLPMIEKCPTFLLVFKEMVNLTKLFVKNHNYEITAFYDPYTLNPLGKVLTTNPRRKQLLIKKLGEKDISWKMIAKNYACLGIYLYILIEAFSFFNDKQYLQEAKKVANKLMCFSPDELFWEPLELAYGVAGFAELYRITNNKKYLDFSKCLILDELRMFYWYEDNSFDWKGKRSILGLIMACVGIRYPAMKENLESIYPWLSFLKIAINTGNNNLIPRGLFKFFNLIRINSFYYFSDVLPTEFIYPPRRATTCPYIPFEDLEMLETPPHFSRSQEIFPKGKCSGVLGREIYGAGEVIFLYLIFEALAKCDNKEIMVLNLDVFDFDEMENFPPDEQNFIVFNPLKEDVTCNISFQRIQSSKKEMKIISFENNKILTIINVKSLKYKEVKIKLKSGELRVIKIE